MRKNTIQDVLLRLVVCEPDTTETGCWEWPGTGNIGNYGQVSFGGKMLVVHRLVYEHFRGSVPEGFEVDHLCYNGRCANIDHLEAVTPKENNLRRRNRKNPKIHCGRGHLLSGDNLYVFPVSGNRRCKTCIREAAQRRAAEAGRVDQAARTHCPQGHHYGGENLYVDKTGRRHCRECARKHARKHYWKMKEVENGSSG